MKGGIKVADFKFYCSKQDESDKDCIIPLDLSPEELFDRDLPLNCLDCQYYVDKKTRMSFEEYVEKRFLKKEN